MTTITDFKKLPASAEIFMGIDTETTGFQKKGALMQEGQVRVLQIAMILVNRQGKMLKQVSLVVKPDDSYSISEGAFKAHGLTIEHCQKYGVSMNAVYSLYQRMAAMADVIVAHNADYDKGVMDVETAFFCDGKKEAAIIERPWFCTMKSNTHIAGGKWPKLAATLEHYTGEKLGEDAHNAFYDTEACVKIFNAMLKKAA